MQSHLNDISDDELRQRFRMEREAKGWSQADLAEVLGSHWVTVSKLERGVTGLSRGWISRLSVALGMTVETTVESAKVISLDARSIGAKIRQARKALDMGQAELASHLGVTVQAVSQWERNETVPSGLNLLKLSSHLHIDLPHGVTVPEQNSARLAELLEQVEEVCDLLHALDKVGDGIGGADGFAVSAVALNAKSVIDNVVDALKAMGAK